MLSYKFDKKVTAPYVVDRKTPRVSRVQAPRKAVICLKMHTVSFLFPGDRVKRIKGSRNNRNKTAKVTEVFTSGTFHIVYEHSGHAGTLCSPSNFKKLKRVTPAVVPIGKPK